MSRVAEAISCLVCDSINKTHNLYSMRESFYVWNLKLLVFISVHSPATFLSKFWWARRKSSFSLSRIGFEWPVEFVSSWKLVRQLTLHRLGWNISIDSATLDHRRTMAIRFSFCRFQSPARIRSERAQCFVGKLFIAAFICQCKKNCEC